MAATASTIVVSSMRFGLACDEKPELIPYVLSMIGHVANLVQNLGPHEHRGRGHFVFFLEEDFGAAILDLVGLVLRAVQDRGLFEHALCRWSREARFHQVVDHV